MPLVTTLAGWTERVRRLMARLAALAVLAACSSPTLPLPTPPPTGVLYFGYSVQGSGRFGAWQVLPDGSEFGRVPHPFESVSMPHVGLAGRWLAYVESGDVFIADLTNPPHWPELPQYDITFTGNRAYPLVSPSGRLVANTYIGPELAQRGIRISRNDQSGIETLLTPPGDAIGSDRAVGWFPGEDSLLIMQSRPNREYSVIRSDGSGRRLPGIPDIQNALSVALSPTGRFVALAAPAGATLGDSASRTISIYEMATSEFVRGITVDEPVFYVLWSPDERFLAYTPGYLDQDPFDLAVIDLATGKRTVILDTPELILRPVWSNRPPEP